MISTTLTSSDLSSLLGLSELPDIEQAQFLARVGELVIESSLLRLVSELTYDQQVALEHYLETNPDPTVFMEYLLTHHASFAMILEEEMQAFRDECVAVMGRGALKEAALAAVPA
jgi:hypothetical protein